MKSFSEFINSFKAGHLDAALTKQLTELVEAVAVNQRVGSLTLAVKLTPKNDGEMHTSVKFTTKKPERDSMDSILYATPDNALINSNPNQPELFSKPMPEKSSPVKAIN